MKSRNTSGKLWLLIAAAALVTASVSPSWGLAVNTKGEAKCHGALSKGIGKHVASVAKALAECNDKVIAGEIAGPCPDAEADADIAKSAEKISKSINKKCQSSCSISGVPCIDNTTCPPNGTLLENCTAGGKNIFNASVMGFPGAFCETIIGHSMIDPEDFGVCAAGIGDLITDSLMENIYGGLTGTPPLSKETGKCLATITKSASKTVGKLAKTVSKCREKQLTADSAAVLPDQCDTADEKTAAKVDKFEQKFADSISKKCTNTEILALDLCGNGVAGTPDVATAQACLGQLVVEAAYSVADADTRPYAGISVINGAYPNTAAARCGDNLVNQLASQFLLNGEECDGDDADLCPGECLPPGDLFECTCGNIRRARAFADGFAADLDNGWSGSSHNSKVTDGAGFVSDISNCDCDEFDPLNPATCIGSTSDPVCDAFAETKPRCTHRIGDGTTCDQVGNSNGAHSDSDCQACDVFADNAGDFCTGSARFCIGGSNEGLRCNQPSDCPGGSCTGAGRCLTGPFAGNGCATSAQCGICVGGTNAGGTCSTGANCPGGSCSPFICSTTVCIAGSNDDTPCSTNGDCTGGGRCASTSDCTSQCYDEDGIPTGPCARQDDCADNERCRGVCDTSNTCLKIRNGAPLPLSAEGTSVCVDSQFFSNVSGTRNIVTGEHAVSYELRSVTILANQLNSAPCPVCGGWCAINNPPTALDRTRCEGRCIDAPDLECRYGPNIGDTCTTNADCDDFLCGKVRCRFDDDCPSGTCSGAASPDCQGKACNLELQCNSGPAEGQACRIEAATAFGTTSADCPPDPATNVSGSGLQIIWNPLGSEAVTLPSPGACDASGYENYDCNCVDTPPYGTGNSTRTQPNRCQPACTDPDPAYFGTKCASFTTCVGGSEAGAACDEDSDCTGGACTGNPRVCGTGNVGECSVKHCAGGSNAGGACGQDGQCPGSTCVPDPCTIGGAPCTDGYCVADNCTTNGDCTDGGTCVDACPAGKCTPLCVGRGVCNGGDKDGLYCALDVDCTGGGTCDPEDPQEGACAQAVFPHCDGPGWEFVSCSPVNIGTQRGCEKGTDDVLGNANDQIGAGYCRADIQHCFLPGGAAEGGDTLNGLGDPTNTYSVAAFCIPASTSTAVNATAGLPGPGRIRQPAVVVPNFTELP